MILKYVRVDMLICPGIWVFKAAGYLYTLIGFWTHLVLNVNNAFKSNSIISFDLGSGEVYINSDPSQEFSQTFEMTTCVKDRRNKVCGTLTIIFSKY